MKEAGQPVGQLVVLSGPHAGTVVLVHEGERLKIGRSPLCELSIPHPTLSREHCELEVGKRRVRVRDLGSRNGTIVEGTAVGEGNLEPGEELLLGHVSIVYERICHTPAPERARQTTFMTRHQACDGCSAIIPTKDVLDGTIKIRVDGRILCAECYRMERERRK